jgi:hypothetical protein
MIVACAKCCANPVAADERCEASGTRGIQATLRRAFAQDAIGLERRRQALERVGTEVLAGKIAPHEPEGGWTDDDRIWCGEPLQAGRNIGRLTQRELFLAAATAHLAHDHQPGVDADAHGQLHPFVLCQAGVERSQCLHNTQTSADGSAGVVFMRLGIAKVHQQPIPEVLRDMAIKVLDNGGGGLLVGAYHLP